MKTNLTAVALAVIALSGCDINKTEDGKVPNLDVDVSADAGELPEFEVNWAEVDVGTTTETVTVPKLVVVTEEEEVEVPYMDVDMPNDKSEKMKRTIVVEAEVKNTMHKLTIDKVYAKNRRLIVVSSLEPTGESIEDETVRIADRIVLNAGDLDVKHIIVGQKPIGDWNNQYEFVRNETDLRKRLDGAREIYSR